MVTSYPFSSSLAPAFTSTGNCFILGSGRGLFLCGWSPWYSSQCPMPTSQLLFWESAQLRGGRPSPHVAPTSLWSVSFMEPVSCYTCLGSVSALDKKKGIGILNTIFSPMLTPVIYSPRTLMCRVPWRRCWQERCPLNEKAFRHPFFLGHTPLSYAGSLMWAGGFQGWAEGCEEGK